MKLLALETSTEYCSVTLHIDGESISKEIRAERRHSALILPMTEEVLSEAELSLTQIDGIAFGAGPGSFTGLRIACGVAQGLAFAVDLPVVGINTLEAIAQQCNQQKIIVALDARMGEIYHAAFQQCGKAWEPICTTTLCQPHQAPPVPGTHWIGCGSGFDVYDKALSKLYNAHIDSIAYGLYPHAREIAQLSIPRFTDGSNTDPSNATPLYIRNKVALKENER